MGRPSFLAAIAATVAAVAIAVAAAAEEQQNQDDDPPAVVATEAVVVAHNEYLQEIFRAICRSFQDIPPPEKGATQILSVRGASKMRRGNPLKLPGIATPVTSVTGSQ